MIWGQVTSYLYASLVSSSKLNKFSNLIIVKVFKIKMEKYSNESIEEGINDDETTPSLDGSLEHGTLKDDGSYYDESMDDETNRRILLLAALYPGVTRNALKRIKYASMNRQLKSMCLSRDWKEWIKDQGCFIGLKLLWDLEIIQTDRPTLLVYFYLLTFISEVTLFLTSVLLLHEQLNAWRAALALMIFLLNCLLFGLIVFIYLISIHKRLNKIQQGDTILVISNQCKVDMSFFETFIYLIASENVQDIHLLYENDSISTSSTKSKVNVEEGTGSNLNMMRSLSNEQSLEIHTQTCMDVDKLYRQNIYKQIDSMNELDKYSPQVVLTVNDNDIDNQSDVSSLSDCSHMYMIDQKEKVADPNYHIQKEYESGEMKNDDEEENTEEKSTEEKSTEEKNAEEKNTEENSTEEKIKGPHEEVVWLNKDMPSSCRSLNVHAYSNNSPIVKRMRSNSF